MQSWELDGFGRWRHIDSESDGDSPPPPRAPALSRDKPVKQEEIPKQETQQTFDELADGLQYEFKHDIGISKQRSVSPPIATARPKTEARVKGKSGREEERALEVWREKEREKARQKDKEREERERKKDNERAEGKKDKEKEVRLESGRGRQPEVGKDEPRGRERANDFASLFRFDSEDWLPEAPAQKDAVKPPKKAKMQKKETPQANKHAMANEHQELNMFWDDHGPKVGVPSRERTPGREPGGKGDKEFPISRGLLEQQVAPRSGITGGPPGKVDTGPKCTTRTPSFSDTLDDVNELFFGERAPKRPKT